MQFYDFFKILINIVTFAATVKFEQFLNEKKTVSVTNYCTIQAVTSETSR